MIQAKPLHGYLMTGVTTTSLTLSTVRFIAAVRQWLTTMTTKDARNACASLAAERISMDARFVSAWNSTIDESSRRCHATAAIGSAVTASVRLWNKSTVAWIRDSTLSGATCAAEGRSRPRHIGNRLDDGAGVGTPTPRTQRTDAFAGAINPPARYWLLTPFQCRIRQN